MTIQAFSSRLLPLESDVWVLALDLGHAKAYVRLTSREWMARISGTVGEEEVTTDGPVLRAVMLDDLPVSLAG